MQMLLVAFSRRMCCSRVCRVSRYAGRPAASTDTPTSRPGRVRLWASRVAMKAAWGPPKPRGTPKRCEEPTTTSAPISPGGRSRTRLSRSAATVTIAPASWAAAMRPAWSRTSPLVPGYCTSTPKVPSGMSLRSPTTTSMPRGTARVRTTSMV